MQLDLLEPITLSAEDVSRLQNAIRASRCLAAGLGFLYGRVRVAELNVQERLNAERGGPSTGFLFGNHPVLNEARQDLVECASQWYAVSLTNFVRAIASMAFGDNHVKRDAYSERVLGPVASFRNKIAAHFAGMTKNSKDNDAERIASLIPQVAWVGDRFELATLSIALQRSGVASTSADIAPWRLTLLHESLAQRYPLFKEHLPTFEQETPPKAE